MIDRSTVQKILDAADIVEVVSDFVSLKRRGANYTGLCPFHNEKTPSFSVSKAKGICKCFSCGKGGSPVNFIMEHEQLSYSEALKYLAKKYHIEVKERELTDKEKETQSERENMLFINDFACNYFANNLLKTTEGREIGLSYFRERGFTDVVINKFHLGYSLDDKDALYKTAINDGISKNPLFKTGLCIENKYNTGYDRFKGRVMFPVFNLAGKVIAFGGRTLKNDPAKYVNSPESLIYKKSNELYGLFQAKQAIVKHEKCYLVEGYTDVISMHQAGIENVVASSGTSLTEGQIRLIHRFTDNVTVLYDGDSAGIKASLRGIDMLLAEGLNIKVLLLPDGEDPDSFARKHSVSEFNSYIKDNETDFIQFKTKILLDGSENDPINRSRAIQDIVKSIAVIPFSINQSVYAKECSRLLDIDEKILINEIAKAVTANKEAQFKAQENSKREVEKKEIDKIENASDIKDTNVIKSENKILYPYETELIRYIIKFGMAPFCVEMENNDDVPMTLLEFVDSELKIDNIAFNNELYLDTYKLSMAMLGDFYNDFDNKLKELANEREQLLKDGIKEIQKNIVDIDSIRIKEDALKKTIEEKISKDIIDYRCNYLEKKLCSHPSDTIRNLALNLATEKHKLSKIHTKNAVVQTEFEKLPVEVPKAINNWKNGIVMCRIKEIQKQLSSEITVEESESLLFELQQLYIVKGQLASTLGDRVVNPKK